MSELSVRETAARALAQLGPDEDWPTNEALGGNPTGTRDDEFRASMLDDADAVLAAVADHDGLADVLQGHRSCPCGCDRCQCGSSIGAESTPFAAHLADVVRAWLRDPS